MTTPCDFPTIIREEQPQAQRIAEYLLRTHSPNVFPPTVRIIDVGCGPGIYVDELRKLQFDAHGVDNDPRLPEAPWFHRVDVTEPGYGDDFNDFDIALSLEVGEHIPQTRSEQYAGFLRVTGAKILYFSAARPGQGGDGHINCQPKNYWTRELHNVGFFVDLEATEDWLAFMRAGYHMGWLTQNGMVFRRA